MTTHVHKAARTRLHNEVLQMPILVVDDVHDNRELLEELLLGEGYKEILSASSGAEALEILETRPDVGLVLLDLMMPGMDGYEVCQRISENAQTSHIPIIVVTGGALRRDEALLKSFERGAMDFLPKPVNEVELFGRVKSALLLCRERVENREKTAALLESQQRYELAVNGVNDGIWDLNLEADQVYYSPQWKRILGYEDQELPNMMSVWENTVHSEDHPRVMAAIQDHWQKRTPYYASEHRLRTKSGEYKWVFSRGRAIWDRNGKVVRMAGSTTDITQRKSLENQLRQSQQLESIGRLAAGVAHDFNNLLTAILGHATFMQLQLPQNSVLHPCLENIQKASLRAADLCKQMLAYAGQGSFSIEQTDANDLIHDTVDLLKVSISKKASLAIDLHPDALLIKVDIAQIRQVVMNLVLNAAEAIGDRSGHIQVRTRVASPSAADLKEAVLATAEVRSRYVRIEVTDTGCGMDQETIDRIFEPFFSTKFAGRGLGLSAVLGILKAHDGLLRVTSQVGGGTSFQVFIPLMEEPEVAPAKPAPSTPERWRGSGTVLVVDDEEGVRMSTKHLLQELGFDVLLARDGDEAVETFRDRKGDIAAVILDLTMPGLSGEEVFTEIRQLRPDTPVLLSSGYDARNAAGRAAMQGLNGFLQKPFEFAELSNKLRTCLTAETIS